MAGTDDWNPTRLWLSRRHVFRLALILSGLALVGCGGAQRNRAGSGNDLLAWPAEDRWPAQFHQAAPEVQEAYRYAVANPDVMRYMPCFCGCGSLGHRANLDCYVREYRDDGSVLLDPMSFG